MSGPYTLDEVEAVSVMVAQDIGGWIFGFVENHTVTIGSPFVIARSRGDGINLGRLDIPIDQSSYVQTSHSAGEELSWFAPDIPDMDLDTDAHVTEADHIRMYYAPLDLAMQYEVHSTETYTLDGFERMHNLIKRQGWARSVFALVPTYSGTWPYEQVPEPHDSVGWPYEDMTLCGWFHPWYGGGLVLFPEARAPGSEQIVEPNYDLASEELRQALSTVPKAVLIDPSKARHMVGVVTADPLAEDLRKAYRTAEVITYPEVLPRPILPRSRRFAAICAWLSDAPAAEWARLLKARGWGHEPWGSYAIAHIPIPAAEEVHGRSAH